MAEVINIVNHWRVGSIQTGTTDVLEGLGARPEVEYKVGGVPQSLDLV